MLDGQPYRRTLERDGKPLPPEEQRSEQKTLDKETRTAEHRNAAEKQRRMDEAEKRRRGSSLSFLKYPTCSTSGSNRFRRGPAPSG